MAGWGGPPFGGSGSYTAVETPKGYRKRTGRKPWSLHLPGWMLSGAAILLVAGGTPFLVTQNAVEPRDRPSIEAPAVAAPEAEQNAQEAEVVQAPDSSEEATGSVADRSEPGAVNIPALVAVLGTVAVGGLGAAFSLIARKSRSSPSTSSRKSKSHDRARARELWDGFVTRHGVLREKLLEIETDWDLIFKYPALTNSTVATTRQFHRALRAADSLSAEPPSKLDLTMDLSRMPYPKLVLEAEDAWQVAWDFARHTGTRLIPKEERGRIDQIVQLLTMARDSGGSDHERAVAYERARKLIGELSFVRIPETALEAIEAEQRKMIESAPAVLQPADSGLLLHTL